MDNTIYELPDPPKPELGDGLLNSLRFEADDILEQKFGNKKQQEDAVHELIKKDYNFDEIKNAFDQGAVPHQIDFFIKGRIVILTKQLNFYHLPMKTENLQYFYYVIRDRI